MRRAGRRCAGDPAPPRPDARGDERAVNVAFRALGCPPARVVLVDDVCTTGATLRAATRALDDGTGRVVSCIVVARTP